MLRRSARRIVLPAVVAACVTVPATDSRAGDPHRPGTTPRGGLQRLFEDPRLLDDPGRLRSRLEDLGLSLQLFYNQFFAWKGRGGGDPDDVFGHSGGYDLFAVVDLEELAGWRGLDFLLHVKGQYERSVNVEVAALSDPIDDADFGESIYVSQLWAQQRFLRDRIRLRIGYLEQQTIFDRNAYANSEDRQFFATFLDNDPVVPLPTGLGAVAVVGPTEWLEIAVGVADADNSARRSGFGTAFDAFESLTAHLEVTLHLAFGDLPGAYRFGVFLDGRERPRFGRTDPSTARTETDRGHVGAWASFDQLLLRERGDEKQGLGLFARLGAADGDVNPIAWFWSCGLQVVGLLPGRDDDTLGVAAYQAIGSSRYRRSVDPEFRRETGFELYYAVALLPWLTVTPDLQFIADPGASDTTRDAMVVALRFRVSF